MKKVIKLTESELTGLVKRILKEVAEEPILTNRSIFGYFGFGEGKAIPNTLNGNPLTKVNVDDMARQIADHMKSKGTFDTIKRFYNNSEYPLPKFIKLCVGTSHTGSGEANAAVAEGRIKFLTGLVSRAMDKLGIDSQMIKRFIVTDTDAEYTPSKLDKNLMDPKKVAVNPAERYGWIEITAMEVRGLDTKGIQNVQRGLNQASSDINNIFIDGVDETEVVRYINNLRSFSDISDLSNAINAAGKFNGLEDFLNDQLFDDPVEMRSVYNKLKNLASEKGLQSDTVRLSSTNDGYKISIGLGR